MRKMYIDLGDRGDIYILSEWEGGEYYGGFWKAEVEALVLNELAESINVPHGTKVKGTFWVTLYNPDGHPDTDDWEAWGFDEFIVLEQPND